MRICKKCGETDSQKLVKRGSDHRNLCHGCHNANQQKWRTKNPELVKQIWKRNKRRISKERKEGKNLDRYIFEDSRGSDRKKGYKNDLTREFITKQIVKGCSYCGETELRMTLDRINNNRGHTEDNVVPACIRCNYIRRDMPYEAWIVVARAMKRARKQNLFGNWTGRARKAGVA